MCLCVCVCVSLDVCVCVSLDVCVCVRECVHTPVWIHGCVHACFLLYDCAACVCVCVSLDTCVCLRVSVRACAALGAIMSVLILMFYPLRCPWIFPISMKHAYPFMSSLA